MPIIGINTLVYGVEDVVESARFFDDFGLPPHSRSKNFAHFRLAEGSNVHIRPLNDPWFLKSEQKGAGVRECIWGVDSQESFDALLDDLGRDYTIRRDADGTARFVTHFGQAIGLKVWSKSPVRSSSSRYNSPGNANRINETRKWLRRAIPTVIQHVVWSFPDVNQTLGFYRDRLKFRLVEIQIGAGVYVRADGVGDHHSIFIADANNKVLGFDGSISFHHANYGVEDIDEIMVGKNYMERRGWPKSSWGLGRHRISSGAFLYLKSPAGGEAEYGADIDVLDDRWRPRIWEALFGSHIYIHNMPQFMLDHEIEWNLGFCSPDSKYPDAHMPGSSAAPSAQSVANGSKT
jgi:catechol 2,3-dioxygenase-like lactoylglutathione lyase family enzyme